MKETTLCLLIKNDEMLLAMKKRGFGAGKWNGCGGKVEAGEDIESAAVREAQEEIRVTIDKSDLLKLGRVEFYFTGNEALNLIVNIFRVEKWTGEPAETEEMRPQWFKLSELPFDQMWLEDKYWMPLFLDKKEFEGEVYYNKDGTYIEEYDIREK